MASSISDVNSDRPLDTFTRSTPPGWRPGVAKYHFRRYVQLLELWYLQTDLAPRAMGPAVAGRLRGAAMQFVLGLSCARWDQTAGCMVIKSGPSLLAEEEHDAILDATGDILCPAEMSGFAYMCQRLKEEYSVRTQEQTLSNLDAFYNCTRASSTMEE